MPYDFFFSRTEDRILIPYAKRTTAPIINKIPKKSNSIKSPRKESAETRHTTPQNQGVCTIVNTVSLFQNHPEYSPTRHAPVCLIPETATLVRTHIVVTAIRMSSIDTDRFPRRLAHRFSSVLVVFPSLNHDIILLFIHRQYT
jgi:hypothetical protein